MLKASTLVALTLPFGLVTACADDPPAPADVRTRIADDLGHVLKEGSAAMKGGSEAFPMGAAFGLFERFGGGATTTVSLKRDARSDLMNRVVGRLQLNPTNPEPEGDAGFDSDRLVEELNTKLFTDANHVGDGIYVVPASLVCTGVGDVVDAECATEFDKIQLRVRTATDDDRLILAMQVGANHVEPLRFTLSHTSLAATLDLDETSQAMTALAPLFGEAPPNARLAGQITGKLEVLGTANAKVSVTFDRALDIAIADEGLALDSADAIRFTSEAANVASLAFDGGAGTGSVMLGLGATTMHIPADESAAVDLDLAGASLVAMLATNQPLQLTHVGLGERTTTLSVGGQRAMAIDLNPDDGRAFSATIAHDSASGLDTITVTPKLDLNVSIDHAVLGDEAPLFDVTRVLLEGSLRSNGEDQVQVMSGSFSIATNPAQFGFTATAGQCITDTIDSWSVGACN
jgi:hypothetical protein